MYNVQLLVFSVYKSKVNNVMKCTILHRFHILYNSYDFDREIKFSRAFQAVYFFKQTCLKKQPLSSNHMS